MCQGAFKGKSLTEYILVAFLVGLVAIPTLSFLGKNLVAGFDNISARNKAGTGDLMTLLSPSRWDDSSTNINSSSTIGNSSGTSNPYGPTQPTETLAFDYDPSTGLVALIDVGSGATTTSGQGTALLVQGLQDLLIDYPDVLTSEQENLLNQLITQGLAMAAEEDRLVSTYPGLVKGDAPNLAVFSGGGLDSSIYHDFMDFSTTYQALNDSITGTDPVSLQIQDVIETNSTLISQLARQNFIKAQLDHDGYPSEIAAADSSTINERDIDVTSINIDETARATIEAANGMP